MARGGFDADIGNPPYIRIQGFPREQVEYLTGRFRSATGNCDLYVSFVERGYLLLRPQGILGLIVPNKFFRTDYGVGLRGLLADESAVREVVDFHAHQVFDATTYTCLLFLTKTRNKALQYARATACREAMADLAFSTLPSEQLSKDPWLFADRSSVDLLAKLRGTAARLLDFPADMSRGSSTGCDDVFMLERGTADVEERILRRPVFATDFGRYSFAPSGQWRVVFPYVKDGEGYRLLSERELKADFPKTYAHLHRHLPQLKKRKQFQEWYGFSAPRNLELHDRAAILVPLLADGGRCALVPPSARGTLCPMASGGFSISLLPGSTVKPEYVLGLLNSRLLFWALRQTSNLFRGGWITCTKQYFGELPVRAIDVANKADKARHDKMVELVTRMMELKRQQARAPKKQSPSARQLLDQKLAITDQQLDALVYELYGLTEDEIRIVGGEKK
jgi:hypothetical protein